MCGRGYERHLEGHPEFTGGLTRRFVRRLVADARVMSTRAVSHHHGVGWHRNIMGLVKVHSAQVAKRRHARRCRVLMVDKTSTRNRHRYMTAVASGDTGEVPAMIPGPYERVTCQVLQRPRTRLVPKRSSSRLRRITLIPGRHRPASTRRAACPRPVPRRPLTHPKGSPRSDTSSNAATHTSARPRSNRTCSAPVSPCYGGRITSPTATRSIWIGSSKLTPGSAPPGKRSKSPPPALRNRQLRRRQPNTGTVRGSIRHRPDTANTRE